jgi:hypothetical protein
MYSHWDEALKIQAQRQAARRAAAAAQAEAQARVDSMNQQAVRDKTQPWEYHAKFFQDFNERQQQEKDERARERAEENWREFNARLNRYRGPLDPLLELLRIKSKTPTQAEIRTAYIAAIRRVHPDLGGSVEDAQRVNAAYEILIANFNTARG